MSAAPLPPLRPKHGICKYPLSVFESLLEICNFTELKCFLLILDRTIGLAAIGKARTWAPIAYEDFAETAVTTPAWCKEALAALVRRGFILERHAGGKGWKGEYSVSPNLAAEAKAAKIKGRCAECKTIGTFTTEFIPQPRTFATKLAPALDHVTFLCVAVVSRYSHDRAWSAEAGLEPKWVDLDRNDFERKTSLDDRSISNGLKRAVELKLIERQDRPGKASRYRTLPENWANVGARLLRVVTPPERETAERAKRSSSESAKNPEKPQDTQDNESIPHRYGYCVQCCHVVEVEPLSDAEMEVSKPNPRLDKPPRAGPARETRPGIDRNDGALEILKKWHGFK